MIFRTILILLVSINTSINLLAQEVVSTDGSFSTNSQGSLSWTLGEVITETFSTTNNFLTQGFQQKLEGFLSVPEQTQSDNLSLFPNPFISEITINSCYQEAIFQIKIFDCQNKLVYSNDFIISVPCEQLSLDLSFLPAGMYFLKFTSLETDKFFTERIIKLKNDK